MAQRSEEWNRLRALVRQTGDIRRVVHPLEQSYGLGLGVAESPDRMLASAVATVDRSTDADDLTDGPLNPFEKRATGGDQGDVRPLLRVVPIGVHEDRTFAVDAAAKEVREKRVGNRERPDGMTFRRREPDAQKPAVQAAVVPLNPVEVSTRAAQCRDRGLEPKTLPQSLGSGPGPWRPATSSPGVTKDSRRLPSGRVRRRRPGAR
jgi:hypothetical protein